MLSWVGRCETVGTHPEGRLGSPLRDQRRRWCYYRKQTSTAAMLQIVNVKQ